MHHLRCRIRTEPQDTAVLLRMRFGSEESITEVHPCRADQQDTCRGQETTTYCHWSEPPTTKVAGFPLI